jgi:hypothetical protein
MEQSVQTQPLKVEIADYQDAWQMVVSQLRMEMSRAMFETWVQPLRPLGYQNGVFTLGAYNSYARDWVESRLKSRVARLLEGMYSEPVTLQVKVLNTFYSSDPPLTEAPLASRSLPAKTVPSSEESSAPPAEPSRRKIVLQRAYGTERARIIQPERGMFVTLYFFEQWLPLLGHSAAATVLAARSLCYWNPMTGELRNVIETDMSELARRAAVSVRTVKDVLNNELIQRYFLRYKVRRMMTPNGIRTAGITLQVRMDDPLTPQDQVENNLPEEETWYFPEFSAERWPE